MNSMLDALSDPHMRHAALVHLPIVMAAVSPLLILVLALKKFRNNTLLGVSLAALLLGSAGGALASNAGEAAEDSLHEHRVSWPAGANDAAEKHEELGENGWIWPLIPAALLAASAMMKHRAWRVGFGVAALAGSVGVTVWAALTAHAGGELVYRYGMGAPSPALTAPAADGAPSAAPRPDHDED